MECQSLPVKSGGVYFNAITNWKHAAYRLSIRWKRHKRREGRVDSTN